MKMIEICHYKKNNLFFILVKFKYVTFYSKLGLDAFEPIYMLL